MNMQEAFDGVWKWFVVERHHAGMRPSGACMYFVDPLTKCAIGCLLSDKVAEELRAMSLRDVAQLFLPEINIEFLAGLQTAHDEAASNLTDSREDFLVSIEERLRTLAEHFNLSIPDNTAVEELIDSTSEVAVV